MIWDAMSSVVLAGLLFFYAAVLAGVAIGAAISGVWQFATLCTLGAVLIFVLCWAIVSAAHEKAVMFEVCLCTNSRRSGSSDTHSCAPHCRSSCARMMRPCLLRSGLQVLRQQSVMGWHSS